VIRSEMQYLPKAVLERVFAMQDSFRAVSCVNTEWAEIVEDMKQDWHKSMYKNDEVVHPGAQPSPRMCSYVLQVDVDRVYLATKSVPVYSPTSPAYSPTSPAYSPTSPARESGLRPTWSD
jgi:hypothetical protein